MRIIESSLIDRREREELCQLQKEKSVGGGNNNNNNNNNHSNSSSSNNNNNKAKKNRRRDKKAMSSVVQKLYNTCRKVFGKGGAGFVPSPRDVERLQLVLDSMTPDDVGLTPEMSYFKAPENGGVPPITYLHLYECHKFSIGIFCLPPSGIIPLHNHPGMTVFSKILFGSMHIKSFDWVTGVTQDAKENLHQSGSQPPGTRLAKVAKNAVFTAPCNTSILYPEAEGNMHCFTAVTSCAVLDVLGPPYNDSEGRHCTYYREFPCSTSSGGWRDFPVLGYGTNIIYHFSMARPHKFYCFWSSDSCTSRISGWSKPVHI